MFHRTGTHQILSGLIAECRERLRPVPTCGGYPGRNSTQGVRTGSASTLAHHLDCRRTERPRPANRGIPWSVGSTTMVRFRVHWNGAVFVSCHDDGYTTLY